MTYEEAQQLIQTPKYIFTNNKQEQQITIHLTNSGGQRHTLIAPSHHSIAFLWQIYQSEKTPLKISLHMQSKEQNLCLIRIDYNGTHKNPSTTTSLVPARFHAYADKVLKEPHIHYHIEGYKTAAWALPLSQDAFPLQSITEDTRNTLFPDIITHFAERIVLKTHLQIQGGIL